MDIDLLSKMVKELILDNDVVVLPGMGAFVADMVPSTFSDKGYTINPPYRRLYFRPKPDDGDLLVKLYAGSNDVSVEVAEKILRGFLSELKTVVHQKKTVVLPGLGRLRATKENNLFFVPDADLDIYPEGFGLEPVSLKTHQETIEEVAAAVGELKDILEEPVPVEPVIPDEPTHPAVPDEPTQPIVPEEPVEPNEPEAPAEPEVPVEHKAVKPRRTLLKLAVSLAAVAVVLLVALAVVGRMYPEWVDQFLYSAEELEIIKHIEI